MLSRFRAVKKHGPRSQPASSTMSDNEDPTASLGYSEVLSVQHPVGDAIPAFNQPPEEGTKRPSSSLRQDTGDVLPDEPARSESRCQSDIAEGEPPARVIQALSKSGDGETLARRAADEEVEGHAGSVGTEAGSILFMSPRFGTPGCRAARRREQNGSTSANHAGTHPSSPHATDAPSMPEQSEANVKGREGGGVRGAAGSRKSESDAGASARCDRTRSRRARAEASFPSLAVRHQSRRASCSAGSAREQTSMWCMKLKFSRRRENWMARATLPQFCAVP